MNSRRLKDKIAEWAGLALTVACCLPVLVLTVGLCLKSRPLLSGHALSSFLLTSDWSPGDGRFGMLAFLAGTISVTALAMVISVPVSLLTAIYLAEYAPRPLRNIGIPVIDLLSGIPSIVFGVFGVLVIVPAVGHLAEHCGVYSSGYCVLSGAIVLAIMACPFIINVAFEVLGTVPAGIREASLSLGATKWQTVKYVVLRRAKRGVVAAVMLGFARAVGETIAVLMVVGNVAAIPRSLFDPAYPLPALMANNYGEMMSVPLYDSALLFSALVLLVIVLVFNLLARSVLLITQRGAA